MPFIKTIHIPYVTHVGHLDRRAEDLTSGRDGPSLAVSTIPQDWQKITGSNAPHVSMFCSNALWIDAFAFTGDCMNEIAAWAVAQQYMTPKLCWAASWNDPQTGQIREELFLDEQSAKAGSAPDAMIDEIEGYEIAPRALRRLGRWHNPLDWYGAALILYTREVVIPKRPLIAGIWWSEPLDVTQGVAPGGQLMPDALERFSVEDSRGDMCPFSEVFPEYSLIGARSVTLTI